MKRKSEKDHSRLGFVTPPYLLNEGTLLGEEVSEEECVKYLKVLPEQIIHIWSIFNPNKESSYVICLVSNNLHGYSMSQDLPCSEFQRVEDEKEKNF